MQQYTLYNWRLYYMSGFNLGTTNTWDCWCCFVYERNLLLSIEFDGGARCLICSTKHDFSGLFTQNLGPLRGAPWPYLQLQPRKQVTNLSLLNTQVRQRLGLGGVAEGNH